jgi:uncharacterized membrane protein YtjA (UPF0391 family)
MIRAAIGFFVLSLVAYVLGANGLMGLSMEIGKILVVSFIALTLISILGAIVTRKGTKQYAHIK